MNSNSTLRITLEMLAVDSTAGAIGSFANGLINIGMQLLLLQELMDTFGPGVAILMGTFLAAATAAGLFAGALGYAVEMGSSLQLAATMSSIAISDGAQHMQELQNAIVNMANTSQYKIADVDMAFRVLGGLGFDTGQILGGMGQQAIILAEALGGPGAGISAADAAQVLGQALKIFGNQGLTAKQAADALTGAFYNNMMSVSDLTEFLGMAGGTAASLGVSFNQLMSFGSMLTPMFGSASSAGASLSYMMRNLAKPSTAAMAAEIQSLGLHVYDSQGKFVGLKNIMDQLFTDTKNMTQQQKMDVFGTLFNVRSGRAAMDLMGETQSEFDATYNKVYGRINQVGQAQRDAAAINNSTIGTWNRLKTTAEDFFARIGEGIGSGLRPFMNALNQLLSTLQQNQGFVKFAAIVLILGTVLFGLVAIVAAVTIAIGILGLVLGGIALPVLIIMAAIMALIIVVALIVVNFGRLKDVAGEVWSWIQQQVERAVSFIGTQLHNLWTTIQGIFNGIKDAIQSAINIVYVHVVQTLTAIKDFFITTWFTIRADVTNLLNDIKNIVQSVITGVKDLFLNDVHAIGDVFGWLYNHNYYWHDLVNDIRTLVSSLVNFLKADWDLIKADVQLAWATVQNDITTVWNFIKNTVQTDINFVKAVLEMVWFQIKADVTNAWNQFQQVISAAWNYITNIVQTKINQAKTILEAAWAIIKNDATAAWNAFEGVLSAAGSAIQGKITNIKNNIVNPILAIGGVLLQAGEHLMQMLAQGILNGLGAVGNAASQVAGKIASFLGFHSPTEEGPGSSADQWMPALMNMLTQGVLQGIPTLQGAANRAAGALGTGFTTPGIAGAQGTGIGTAGGNQQFTVNLQVDDKTLAQAFFEVVNGQMRQNGYTRTNR
jgi:TP901 family phage tail tape measure protein